MKNEFVINVKIDGLKELIEAIKGAKGQSEEVITETVTPAVPIAEEPTKPVVPTVSTSYSLDDLSSAAMQLMDAGKQSELMALLAEFGVIALPSLPVEQYGAFAVKLRELGANF